MTDLPKLQLAVKKLYTSPKLVRHGDVRCLTQGGSVAKVENNGHRDGKF